MIIGRRAAVAAVLGGLGLGLLSWGMWPVGHVTQRIMAELPLLGESSAIMEPERSDRALARSLPVAIILDYPRWARVGDRMQVRLRMIPAAATPKSDQGPVISEDHAEAVDGTPAYPIWIQSRLDVPCMIVAPGGDVTSTWLPDNGVAFTWSVRSRSTCSAQGTAWMFVVAATSNGLEGQRAAVSAQPLHLETTSAVGLSGPAARIVGASTTVLASLIAVLALNRPVGGSGPRGSNSGA